MNIRSVLLDMDGLMLDSEPAYRRAWQSAAAPPGYELSDQLYLTLIGRNNRDTEDELVRFCGAVLPLDRFRRGWPLHWRAEVETTAMPVLMIPDIKPPSAQAATAAFHILKSPDEAAESPRPCLQPC